MKAFATLGAAALASARSGGVRQYVQHRVGPKSGLPFVQVRIAKGAKYEAAVKRAEAHVVKPSKSLYGREHLVMVDASGTLGRSAGTAHAVNFSADQIPRMMHRQRPVTVVHNHPIFQDSNIGPSIAKQMRKSGQAIDPLTLQMHSRALGRQILKLDGPISTPLSSADIKMFGWPALRRVVAVGNDGSHFAAEMTRAQKLRLGRYPHIAGAHHEKLTEILYQKIRNTEATDGAKSLVPALVAGRALGRSGLYGYSERLGPAYGSLLRDHKILLSQLEAEADAYARAARKQIADYSRGHTAKARVRVEANRGRIVSRRQGAA